MQLLRRVNVKINNAMALFSVVCLSLCPAARRRRRAGSVLICQCQWVIAFLGIQSLVLVIGRWLGPEGQRWPWKGRLGKGLKMSFYLIPALNPCSCIFWKKKKKIGRDLGTSAGQCLLRIPSRVQSACPLGRVPSVQRPTVL